MPPINGTKGWSALAGTLLAGVLGSGSGVFVYMKNFTPDQLQQIARPDPATGTQLRRLEAQLRHHFDNHPDIVNSFDRRLTRIETKLELLLEERRRPPH